MITDHAVQQHVLHLNVLACLLRNTCCICIFIYMHFQFYLFWPVLNFFVLALVLRNGGFAEVCLARKLKTPATTLILRGSKKLKYLMYSNAKVSSKLFMCVEYFLLYFDYCYIYSYYCCYYYHHYLYMCMEYFLMGQKKSVPSSFRFSREATM